MSAASPDDYRNRPCKRGDHKAEIDPRPIPLGSSGKHEKMDHNPQTHRESQSKPNQIGGGLVYGRERFALRTANPYRHGHERADKQRSKNNGQYSQPCRDGRSRGPDARWNGLLRVGAHEPGVSNPPSASVSSAA